ncbi:MAG: YceI family protein [Planctomycetota bacterium]|nr:MAG: YceI family protein [Planctomycetota bacterium]
MNGRAAPGRQRAPAEPSPRGRPRYKGSVRYELREPSSTLRVWTFKDGLLARAAHDLCLEARGARAPCVLEEGRCRVEVRVPVAGLRVLGQVRAGEVIPLSAKDHADIEETLRGPRVLDAARHPEVVYRGEGPPPSGGEVERNGELRLRGRPHPLCVRAAWEGAGQEVEVRGEIRLSQSDFGIEPFRALLGALRVRDEVRVSWNLRYRPAK